MITCYHCDNEFANQDSLIEHLYSVLDELDAQATSDGDELANEGQRQQEALNETFDY